MAYTNLWFGLTAYFNIQLYERTSMDFSCRGPTPHTLSCRVRPELVGQMKRSLSLVLLGELVPEGVADGAAGSLLL